MLKEYTLFGLLSIIVAIVIDKKTKVFILNKKFYWFFLSIIFLFKLLVNGYLTGSNIVIYNPNFFMGLRFLSIPIEDFLFGFSMVTLTIIFWEKFKENKTRQ